MSRHTKLRIKPRTQIWPAFWNLYVLALIAQLAGQWIIRRKVAGLRPSFRVLNNWGVNRTDLVLVQPLSVLKLWDVKEPTHSLQKVGDRVSNKGRDSVECCPGTSRWREEFNSRMLFSPHVIYLHRHLRVILDVRSTFTTEIRKLRCDWWFLGVACMACLALDANWRELW